MNKEPLLGSVKKRFSFAQIFIMINCFILGYNGNQACGKDLMNAKHMPESEFILTGCTMLTLNALYYANCNQVKVSKVPPHLRKLMLIRMVASLLTQVGLIVGIRTLPLTILMLIINTNSFTTGIM